MTELVSILIPAFNSSAWIEATLESAIRQSWPRTEIIVVDDGSTDDTGARVARFAERGVRLVRQHNAGAAAARNTAFACCRGDYIQWLDADDLLSPTKIERQMLALRESRATTLTLLSCGWGKFLFRPEFADVERTALWSDLTPVEWLMLKMEHNLHMSNSTWLVSRQLTERAGPWDTRLVVDDDGEYFCRVLMACDGVKFVEDALSYYRMSGYSSMSYIGRSRRKLEAQWLSMQLHIAYLLSLEDSPRTRRACLRYIEAWFIHFYPQHADLVEQMRARAGEMGGELREPHLSWKYRWVRHVFGWPAAHRARMVLPRLKWTAKLRWDRWMSRRGQDIRR